MRMTWQTWGSSFYAPPCLAEHAEHAYVCVLMQVIRRSSSRRSVTRRTMSAWAVRWRCTWSATPCRCCPGTGTKNCCRKVAECALYAATTDVTRWRFCRPNLTTSASTSVSRVTSTAPSPVEPGCSAEVSLNHYTPCPKKSVPVLFLE